MDLCNVEMCINHDISVFYHLRLSEIRYIFDIYDPEMKDSSIEDWSNKSTNLKFLIDILFLNTSISINKLYEKIPKLYTEREISDKIKIPKYPAPGIIKIYYDKNSIVNKDVLIIVIIQGNHIIYYGCFMTVEDIKRIFDIRLDHNLANLYCMFKLIGHNLPPTSASYKKLNNNMNFLSSDKNYSTDFIAGTYKVFFIYDSNSNKYEVICKTKYNQIFYDFFVTKQDLIDIYTGIFEYVKM